MTTSTIERKNEDLALANAARRNQGFFAWPAVLMGVGVLILFLAVSALCVAGIFPLWFGTYLNFLIMIRSFAPAHEALHGNLVGGKRDLMWFNHLLGHALCAMTLLEYQVFRNVHIHHHRRANEADLDPDFTTETNGFVPALLRALAIVPAYNWFFLRRILPREASRLRQAVLLFSQMSVYVLAATALLTSFASEALMVWVLPAFLATTTFSLSHWYLHAPHDSVERFLTAKIVRAAGWRGLIVNYFYCFQNYHLLHHMFPRIPFYRHSAVFREIEPILRRHKARIS